MFDKRDEAFMLTAIEAAREAESSVKCRSARYWLTEAELLRLQETPPILSCDPTAHAEVRVLRDAGRKLSNYRLVDTTLYSTVEPCLMCVGAIIHARVGRVVYGCPEPKAGALVLYGILEARDLQIIASKCKEECSPQSAEI